ncbi:conserved hypothetical protein [Rhizobium rhizogenes K84]|uniref:Uncharacterized protein n=1 Tax=Rhizobium rhizogenes (strain K84 / ATCC BAA-868) TaxID=311403 RepID=B9JNY9_RHIR8|nr:conserved hypothetical protein [Rhizobium rhizogenes K84]
MHWVGRDTAETRVRPEAWNRSIHRMRGRIEIFGTWKRRSTLRRMR